MAKDRSVWKCSVECPVARVTAAMILVSLMSLTFHSVFLSSAFSHGRDKLRLFLACLAQTTTVLDY